MVHATTRLLFAPCLLILPTVPATAQSNLDNCPTGSEIWSRCIGKHTAANGDSYEGEWKDNEPIGKGTLTFANGSTYVGLWEGDWFYTSQTGGIDYTYPSYQKSKMIRQTSTANVGTEAIQSSLPPCPADQSEEYDNCYGAYKLQTGSSYHGEFKRGTFDGMGEFIFPSGDRYVGRWKLNKREGEFSVHYSNGGTFSGDYHQDKRTGGGTYTWANGSVRSGDWKMGRPVGDGRHFSEFGDPLLSVRYNDLSEYTEQGEMIRADTLVLVTADAAVALAIEQITEGTVIQGLKDKKDEASSVESRTSLGDSPKGNAIKGDLPSDFRPPDAATVTTQASPELKKIIEKLALDQDQSSGTYTFANGDEYTGPWKNGPHGWGKYKFSDGNEYVGEFVNGMRNGRGTFSFASGGKYEGEFVWGSLFGPASVSYSNGDVYKGRYVYNKRSGEGAYTWKDGARFIGDWSDGLPVVGGVHTDKNGIVFAGVNYQSNAKYTTDQNVKDFSLVTPDILTYMGGRAQKEQQQPPFAANNNPRKVALVIGNSSYQNAVPLDNPHNDAEAITSLLKSIGFDVVSGTDLDKRATEQKIAEFVDRAAQSDVSLFYYAGHGIQVAGENFIVPVDARVEKASSIDFELVNVSMVTNYMGGEKRIGIALLDACRDNPFTRSLSRALGNRSNQVNSGLAELRSEVGGLLVGFATAPGDVAADGVGMKNSPFTTALLRHLGTKGLEVELMMKRVKADVIGLTKNQQRPWTNSDLAEEVYLAGP